MVSLESVVIIVDYKLEQCGKIDEVNYRVIMFQAATGINYGDESFTTGARATQEAFTKLAENSEAGRLVIVFASVKYNQEEMLRGVRSVSGDIPLVGVSTAGEIVDDGPARKNSVAVMVIATDQMTFYPNVAEDVAGSAREAGRIMAERVKKGAVDAGGDVKFFMMFPDVLAGNGSEIVRGVLAALGDGFPIVGGAAGDDFLFEKTYQYLNDKVYSGAVVGVGLGGEFALGVGVKHGWTPIGLPKRVTKSEGAVIHEIDGKPAVHIYQDYFGEQNIEELKNTTLAHMAIMYPLGISTEGGEEMLIRDPLTVDENGAITCAAEVPEGADVRVMVGSTERAVEAAGEAAEVAKNQLGGRDPQAILVFDCIARRKLFGKHSMDEIHEIHSKIGLEVPLIGFYTYGELAPTGGEEKDLEGGNSEFYNETVVLCALAE